MKQAVGIVIAKHEMNREAFSEEILKAEREEEARYIGEHRTRNSSRKNTNKDLIKLFLSRAPISRLQYRRK